MKPLAITLSMILLITGTIFGSQSTSSHRFLIEVLGGVWTVAPALNMSSTDQTWRQKGENMEGFSIRYKPGDSFSFGFSSRRAAATYALDRSVQNPYPTSIYDMRIHQFVSLPVFDEEHELINMLAFVNIFDFRWEIMPSWRIHPSLTIGGGAAWLELRDDYTSFSWYADLNSQIIKDNAETRGLLYKAPNIIPVAELLLGLKVELVRKKLSLGFEAGFFNGLVYFVSLAYGL